MTNRIRYLVVLISAVAFLASTLTWWGHHASGRAHALGAFAVASAPGTDAAHHAHHDDPHSAGLAHAAAHGPDTSGTEGSDESLSCCVATCIAAMPLLAPDLVSKAPLQPAWHLFVAESGREALRGRELRPPRYAVNSDDRFGPPPTLG